MLEAKYHSQTCCVSLTYADPFLPVDGQLRKRDLQLFIKSLRERLAPRRIRYFGCGEYGEENLRPHYHVIIFGFVPDDLRDRFWSGKSWQYFSDFLAKIWQRGRVTVSELTYRAAFYTAKYMQKFISDDFAVKPFLLMSRRPGIGTIALEDDCDFFRDQLYLNGRCLNIPRPFWEIYKKKYGDVGKMISRKFAVLRLRRASKKDNTLSREQSENQQIQYLSDIFYKKSLRSLDKE